MLIMAQTPASPSLVNHPGSWSPAGTWIIIAVLVIAVFWGLVFIRSRKRPR